MNNNLEKIRMLCKKDHSFNGNISDEYLFTVNCVDYFFFNKNIGQVDIFDGFVDGAKDGGIDFIFDDSDKIYLIQGKSSSLLSYNDIRDLFFKMAETVKFLDEKNYENYNKNVCQKYRDIVERLELPEKVLILFTNTDINDSLRDRINKLSEDKAFASFTLQVYGKEEIETQVLNVENTAMTVKEGRLDLDSPKNILEYNEGQAIIVSIKANSLKKVYNDFSGKGLFGYNLREHIIQKNVDNAIDKTIKNEPQNFWFYNNGITIACSDYRIDGNKLVLYDFSIINGAQTTTKIGKSTSVSDNNDFALVCKVIKSEKSLDDDFIVKISEASNSQKPIRLRDLKSNSIEQKKLQQNSRDCDYPLAIEIKRGVKPSNYKRVDSWQRVSNEYIGQLLMSFQYQQPGSARNNKNDIFGKDTVYNMIFSRDKINNYSYAAIYDFVRIAKLYDAYRIEYIEENEKKINANSDNESLVQDLMNKNSVCNNAKFTILALLGFFYKKTVLGIDNVSDERFNHPNIEGEFTLGYSNDDYQEKLEYLFEFMIDKISDCYDKNLATLKLTSHSNFLKINKTYKDIIIPTFDALFNDKYDKDKILDNIRIFTSE